MENEFNYNEHAQADFFSGVLYYFYKHDKEWYRKFSDAEWEQQDSLCEEYSSEKHINEYQIALTGVIEMINDGVLKSPSYFAWELTPFVGTTDDYKCPLEIDNWINRIQDPQKQIDLINYLIDAAEIIYVYDHDKRSIKTHLKALLAKPKAAIKERKDTQKNDYSLTVDEIIGYVQNEAPEAAPTIKNMLLHFLLEKPKWSKAHIKNVVNLLSQKPTTLIQIENNEGPITAN